MCRNIKPLFNFEPPATEAEIHATATQFVRKVSGFTRPSSANEAAFDRAVAEIAASVHTLLGALVTSASPKDRDVEAAKARARSARGDSADGITPDWPVEDPSPRRLTAILGGELTDDAQGGRRHAALQTFYLSAKDPDVAETGIAGSCITSVLPHDHRRARPQSRFLACRAFTSHPHRLPGMNGRSRTDFTYVKISHKREFRVVFVL